jgi:hypothetical protein
MDLGRAHVAMTEQFLNRPDVVRIRQQVRRRTSGKNP